MEHAEPFMVTLFPGKTVEIIAVFTKVGQSRSHRPATMKPG
jgi:uncharacterized cupredoxin-like copper-binding protein